jgi:hypothetical protein
LAVAWVWFAELLPASPEEATGLLKKLYELADAAGRPAVGIAVSFAAYLIGAVATEIWTRILRMPVRLANQLGSSLWYYAFYKLPSRISTRYIFEERQMPWLDPVMREVHEIVVNELDSKFQDDEHFRKQVSDHLTPEFSKYLIETASIAYPAGRNENESEMKNAVMRAAASEPYARRQLLTAVIFTLYHAANIIADLKYVPERIMEAKPKIFERYDQMRSEAEFRTAVAVPIIFLGVALIARTTLSVAAAMLPVLAAIILLLQGGIKDTLAQVQLAQAIRVRSADSPPLDRMKKGQISWQRTLIRWRRTPFRFIAEPVGISEFATPAEDSGSEPTGVDGKGAASVDNVHRSS